MRQVHSSIVDTRLDNGVSSAPMTGNVNRDVSIAVVCGGATTSEDVARSACVVSAICTDAVEGMIGTDAVEGMKRIASEATIEVAHSQRAGLCRSCADLSSASAAKPISKLTTME